MNKGYIERSRISANSITRQRGQGLRVGSSAEAVGETPVPVRAAVFQAFPWRETSCQTACSPLDR